MALGIHEQKHLLLPYIPQRAGLVRGLPFRVHRDSPLHPLSPSIWMVRSKESSGIGPPSSRRRPMLQRRPAQSSLAYSSITFYQLARILLTPMVVLINYVAYKSTIPRQAGYALIPVCVGVGVVSYYDSLPQEVGEEGVAVPSTRPIGVVFALSGVLASSLYTIWIKTYHKKLDMNSMQLLFNQTPLGVLMLFYIIPWTDRMPNWDIVPAPTWAMIILVCVWNISLWIA